MFWIYVMHIYKRVTGKYFTSKWIYYWWLVRMRIDAVVIYQWESITSVWWRNITVTCADFTSEWITGLCRLKWELTWEVWIAKSSNFNFISIPEISWLLFFIVGVWGNENHLITRKWINTWNSLGVNLWIN